MATNTQLQIAINAKDNASATLRSIGSQLGTLGKSPGLSLLSTAAKVATGAIVGLGAGITAIGISGLKSAADIETLKVALKTAMGGNQSEAGKAFTTISKFANNTPYQMEEVLRSFIKLKNMGLDPGERALTAYGNTASAMGKSLNDMVEAVADATTGEFERLKEFGIRSSQEGDKVKFTFKGITTTVGKNSKEIEQYLMKLAETNFSGGIADQAKTLWGLLSTLKDSWSLLAAEIITDSGVLDMAKNASKKLTEAIENNKDAIKSFVKDAIEKIIAKGKDWIEQMGGPEGIKNKLIEVALGVKEFGKRVIEITPKLLNFVEKIANIVEKVSGFIKQNEGLGSVLKVILAIAASAVILNPIGAVIVGITLTIKNLIEIVKALRDIFVSRIYQIKGDLTTLGYEAILVSRRIKDAFGGVGDAIKNGFGNAYEWVKNKFDGLKGFFRDMADGIASAFKGIGNRIENYFGDIANAIRKPVENAAHFINKIIAGYNRTAGKLKLPTIDEINWGERRAFGGGVNMGMPYVVGEHRPEVFVPSQSGNIRQVGQMGSVSINFNNVSISNEADENRLVDKISEVLSKQYNLGSLGIR